MRSSLLYINIYIALWYVHVPRSVQRYVHVPNRPRYVHVPLNRNRFISMNVVHAGMLD